MKLITTIIYLALVFVLTNASYISQTPKESLSQDSKIVSKENPKETSQTSQPITPKASNSEGRPKPSLPGKMILDDPDNKNSEFAGDKGKVSFDHDQHVTKDSCVTCHHTNSQKLTRAVEEPVLKCATCHKEEEVECTVEGTNEQKKFKGLTAVDSQTAFHGNGTKGSLIGCIDCHKTRNQKPTSCKECHSAK